MNNQPVIFARTQ